MKLRKTLAGILGAVVMLLGVGTFEHVNRDTWVHAAEIGTSTIDFSGLYNANTSVDGKNHVSNDSVFTVVFNKNSGSTAPQYYTSGTAVRLYAKGTMTVSSSYSITQIVLAFGSSDKTNTITTDCGSFNTNTWSGTSKTVVFTVGGTKDHRRIKSVTVTYEIPVDACEHMNTTEEITNATCTSVGTKNVVCDDCGALVSSEEIPMLSHEFENGVCTGCKLDAISGVKALFNEYYNNNQYLKETVLNTTGIADEEVKTYFHASASVKERETWYFGDKTNGTTKLVMNTHEDLEDDDVIGEVDVTSTYENKENKVYHTGKGGDWFVNWTSVEDKFVTLKDFIDSTETDKNWVCDDNKKVFTYNLTPATADSEHEMTRMAREFVAPMWLAPNADNYTYARFTKLTVEEKTDVGLIMKLYVHEGDFSKTSGNDGVFAVATINNVYNVEINIEGNGTVVEENRLIAGNHAIEYTVNIPEGHRISSANANGATIGTTTEGFALNKATGDVIVNLVVEEKSNDPITETLSFATTASRKSFSTTSQVWVNGGITFTNNKSTSTNNVADYSNPIRLYKNSEIIIEANQMTKLVLNSSTSSGDYYNALKSSLDAASIKYTNSGTKFTIEFAAPVDSFVLKLSGGQVRFTSIDVTYIAE